MREQLFIGRRETEKAEREAIEKESERGNEERQE
jgi:hypothetical protein